MGLPAARVLDPAGHGGFVTMGAPSVLIGGMPAARVGDPIACPGFTGPIPHIIGNINFGSTSVMIFGAFAARQTDMTGCGLMGVSGFTRRPFFGPPTPPPAVAGSFEPESGSLLGRGGYNDDSNRVNSGFFYGEHTGFENSEGDAHAVKGSFVHLDGSHSFGEEGDLGTLTWSADGLTGSGEVHGSNVNHGESGGASAGVSVVSGRVAYTDPNGSSLGGSGGLFNASAGVDTLMGTDGRRTGIALGATAQASVAEGQVDIVSVFRIPFTNYSLNIGETIGGSVGSVGGAGALGAYHDAADNRYHLMGMVDIEVVLGFKLGLDISFGQAPPLPPGITSAPIGIGLPMTPGIVIMGCPTVLIG